MDASQGLNAGRFRMAKTIWGMNRFELFNGLNAMELQEISKISTKVQYQKGDIITDATAKGNDIYILIEGRVDIVSLHGVSLYRVSNGETFGEMAVVTNVKRTAVAIAREDSWVLVLNLNHLESLGEQQPDIYRKVYRNIIQSLGIKLARANKLIELLKSELAKALRKT